MAFLAVACATGVEVPPNTRTGRSAEPCEHLVCIAVAILKPDAQTRRDYAGFARRKGYEQHVR